MKDLFLDFLKGLLMGICFIVLCLILASVSSSVYSKTVHPHGELALVGYQFSLGAQSERAFFVRYISMRSHLYGEAGEGHPRMCRFSNEPVDQPFSALPPSFGRDWQSFY